MIQTSSKLDSRPAAYSPDKCGFVDVMVEDDELDQWLVVRVRYEWQGFCRGDHLSPDEPGCSNILSVEVLSIESMSTGEVTIGRESCQVFDARAEGLVMKMRGIDDRIASNEPDFRNGRRWK